MPTLPASRTADGLAVNPPPATSVVPVLRICQLVPPLTVLNAPPAASIAYPFAWSANEASRTVALVGTPTADQFRPPLVVRISVPLAAPTLAIAADVARSRWK